MTFKTKKGRLLSALLAVAMAVTFIPVTAFAVEPLTLLSAGVTSDGGVGLTFNKELSTTDIVNKIKAGFTITGLEETPKTITNVTLHSVSGGTNNFVQLYLNPTVKGGEVAGLSYTSGDVQAADGGMLAEIASMDIENNAPHPDLVTTAPPAAIVGSAYTHTLTASGGTGPYTFSVDGGNLPSGLTMSSTGVISGTPTVAASFTFFIMVRDANQALDIEGFNITVNAPTAETIEVGDQAALIAALSNVSSGGVIKLTGAINCNTGIVVNGKSITFDVGAYTLNVTNAAGPGLEVKNGGQVDLIGSGAFNVESSGTGTTGVFNGVVARAGSKATVTNAGTTNIHGRGAYAEDAGAEITILGDVESTGDYGYGVQAWNGGNITVGGTITAKDKYLALESAVMSKEEGVTDSEKSGYLRYSRSDSTSVIWVKGAVPGGKVCEIGGTQYDTLDLALGAVADGQTITLLQSIDYTTAEGIIINGKTVTFNLAGHTLNVGDESANKGIVVTNGGKLELFDDSGILCVTASGCAVDVTGSGSSAVVTSATSVNNIGVAATAGGRITVSGDAVGKINAVKAGAPSDTIGSTVTVGGDAKNTDNDRTVVAAARGSQVTVEENVTTTGTGGRGVDALDSNTKVHVKGNVQGAYTFCVEASKSAQVTVDGNVTSTAANSSMTYGVRAQSKAEVIVKGNVSANNHTDSIGVVVKSVAPDTPTTVAVDGTINGRTYIKLDDVTKTATDKTTPSTKSGYHTYMYENAHGTHTVWVRDSTIPFDVCEIGGTPYATLDEALTTIHEGETETITLLKNIAYDKGITLINKKITFVLNGHTLNVVSSIEGAPALAVSSGGCVYLSGAGALNVTGPARGYGVTVASNTTPSVVTVTNATGIGTESKAAHAYNNASLTVLEDVTATGINSFGVHAQAGAVVEVRGNVSADNQGVCVSDATAKVTGNVQSNGNDLIGNPEGIGVNVYDGIAEIGGDVTANRVGAMVRAGGSVTIEGEITAPDYIQFADDEPIAIGDYITTTTKEGYRTYQHPTAGTVWMLGEMPITTYALTVANGTGGGSYAKDAVISITANTAPSGQRFKEWSITPSVTFAEGTNKTSQTAKIIMPAQPVAATVVYEALPASEYTITVQNDGNGIASANFNSAAEGAEITLAATPNSGYRFKEWQVISGGVTVENNKFYVLDSAVVVKAIFELIPAESYNVTVNGSYAGVSGAGNYAQSATVTIDAGSRSGYTFTGWVSPDGVIFSNANSATTSFTMPAKNISVTANWNYNGGGGNNDGGSSGDRSTTPVTTAPEKQPNPPVTAVAAVTATAGVNGAASVSVPDKAITDAIAKAQDDAKAQGNTANGISVGLDVTMPQGATSLTTTLTQTSLNGLVSAGVSQLALDGAPVSLGLDLNALREIQKQSSGNISITIAPATGLSKEAKALLGNRPVYSITISYVKDGKPVNITSLGSGAATLSIPYTPGKNEAVGYLFGVYVDANGNVQRIPGSAYDANSGSLLIPTGHFSVYGVGYTAPSAKFTDIGTHWGKEAIDYVVGRGLLSGTSETTFAPNTAMTRGMLVTALGRLAGVDVKTYTTNSFTDVKADSAFCPYIEWAYKKGIVQGIGNQQFAPDRAITREEIAVIFENYAKATGYKLPITREAAAYADASSIGSTYNIAVTAMQQAGIMMGGSGNKFNPKASATRAELSAMLHRYIKLTIDPATAQGWALSDAGQYLYYKDGKALTGTQTIDGVKYFFETNGTLKTGWIKDGDNWRFYSGNKMLVGWWNIGSDSTQKTYYFDASGNMVSDKWLQIDDKWYYFYADGSLARSTNIDGYEVDENGARKVE
jgi:uncharacterized repeat protein (TIGR02543 family)